MFNLKNKKTAIIISCLLIILCNTCHADTYVYTEVEPEYTDVEPEYTDGEPEYTEEEPETELEDLDYTHPFLSEITNLPILKIRKFYTRIQKYYLPVPKAIDKGNCSTVIGQFFGDIGNGIKNSWALRMADSWGKMPDGFLFGNVHLVGMYEECLLVKGEVSVKNDNTSFTGKYCTIYYRNTNFSISDLKNTTAVDQPLPRSGPAMIYFIQPLPYNYATCMPSVCTSDDLYTSMDVTLSNTDREIFKIVCTDEEDNDGYDSFDRVISSIIGILVCFVIIGTILEAWFQEFIFDSLLPQCKDATLSNSVKMVLFCFCCFSLRKNFKSIFQYRKRSSKDEITCLHGMRTITLIWIMTCHQYASGIRFAVNTENAAKYQDPYFGQLITNGYPSVDTFFCISGMLLMVRLMPQYLNGQGLQYFRAFVRRIIRLSPSIFIVAGFSATLLRFCGWGPRNWYLREWSLSQCRDNWWKDFLFIDNYVIGENHGITVNDCLGQCWYTAVEMQLFLIAPFVLIPLGLQWNYGLIWLGFLTICSMVIPGVILICLQLPPLPLYYLTPSQHFEYLSKYYLVPWCRAAPWFVGMWGGLYIVKKHKWIPTSKSIIVVIGYLISLSIGLSVVLGTYQYNHVGDHSEMKYWLSGFYAAFSRPAWALAVVWVIVTCHQGFGGNVNVFLSWWGWQPLSRLTFCMYLISPVVQMWWASVQYIPPYYNYTGKLFETSGVFFISFICAILVSVLIERPLLEMTRSLATSRVQTPGNSEINYKIQTSSL